MEKQIFMYNEKAAPECNVLKTNPLKLIIIYIFTVCISLFVIPLSLLLLPDFILNIIDFLTGDNSVKLSMLLWEIVTILGFVCCFKWIKTVYWTDQIAFIKVQATFNAIKLVYSFYKLED